MTGNAAEFSLLAVGEEEGEHMLSQRLTRAYLCSCTLIKAQSKLPIIPL